MVSNILKKKKVKFIKSDRIAVKKRANGGKELIDRGLKRSSSKLIRYSDSLLLFSIHCFAGRMSFEFTVCLDVYSLVNWTPLD